MIKWREEFRKQYKEEHPDNRSVSAVSLYYEYKSIKFLLWLVFGLWRSYWLLNLIFRLAKLVAKNGKVWPKLWVLLRILVGANNNNKTCFSFLLFGWFFICQKIFLIMVWNIRRKLHMLRRQRSEKVNTIRRCRHIIWNW